MSANKRCLACRHKTALPSRSLLLCRQFHSCKCVLCALLCRTHCGFPGGCILLLLSLRHCASSVCPMSALANKTVGSPKKAYVLMVLFIYFGKINKGSQRNDTCREMRTPIVLGDILEKTPPELFHRVHFARGTCDSCIVPMSSTLARFLLRCYGCMLVWVALSGTILVSMHSTLPSGCWHRRKNCM